MPGVEDHPELQSALETAQTDKKENNKFLSRLKKRPPKDLDAQVHALHEETFEQIDCLDCANCCKTISPIFKSRDIDRIAKKLRMKPGDFIAQYLRLDEDEDYVLQSSPCPFLGFDNKCDIYDFRPTACAEYPHTHHRKWHQHIPITKLNTLTCPAVAGIVERLKEIYNG